MVIPYSTFIEYKIRKLRIKAQINPDQVLQQTLLTRGGWSLKESSPNGDLLFTKVIEDRTHLIGVTQAGSIVNLGILHP